MNILPLEQMLGSGEGEVEEHPEYPHWPTVSGAYSLSSAIVILAFTTFAVFM